MLCTIICVIQNFCSCPDSSPGPGRGLCHQEKGWREGGAPLCGACQECCQHLGNEQFGVAQHPRAAQLIHCSAIWEQIFISCWKCNIFFWVEIFNSIFLSCFGNQINPWLLFVILIIIHLYSQNTLSFQMGGIPLCWMQCSQTKAGIWFTLDLQLCRAALSKVQRRD